MTQLLYADLTYAIRGVLMQVHFHNHHLGSVPCRLIVVDDKMTHSYPFLSQSAVPTL